MTRRSDGTLFVHTRAISVDPATDNVRIKCRQCKTWVDRVRGPVVRSLVVALGPSKGPSST